MGGSSTKHDYHLTDEELNRVKEETGFTTAQVKRLFHRFQVLDVDGVGYLTKDELLRVQEVRRASSSSFLASGSICELSLPGLCFQIVLNPLGDKIVDSFFEKDNEFLDFIDFARTFAVFRPVKDSTPKDAVNSRDAKVKSIK